MADTPTLDQFNQFWECPVCGGQIATGEPAKFTQPPSCSFGHGAIEMEQKTAEAFQLPEGSEE